MKNERSIPTAINSRNVFTLVLSLVRRLISLLPGAPRLPQFQRRPARINPATPFRFLLIPYLVFLNLQAQPAERIQSRPGSLIIELSLDSVRVGLQGEIISSPALSQAYFSDGPLPVYQECFLQLPQDTRIQVFPGTVRSFPLDSPVVTVREQGKGAELEEPPSTPSPGADQWYSLDASPSNLGTLIRLYPIHRIGDEIFWTPHLSLLFTWPADGSPPAQPLSETRFSDQSRSPGSRSDWSGPPVPDYQFSSDLARINVDHKGWYGITYVDLVDSNVAITDVDPRTFRLWDGDRECPLIVEGEADGDFSSGDRIIFRGEPAPPPEGVAYRSNFYTSSHTYWLTWGGNPGRRYIEESAYPEAPLDEVHHPDSFRDTLHLESNDYFARLGSRNLHDEWDRFDHFFMNPPIQGGTSVDFNLEVDYPTSSMEQRFSLIAEFQGITNNTHQLQVTLNHLLLGSADWTGQDQLLFETDPGQQLPNSSLSHGDNVLTCTLSGDDPTNRYDQVYLNWVELIYDREFRAADNRLAFRRNSVLPMINQFQISGFTTANIYLVKDDLTRLTDFLIVPSDEGYTAVFQDYTASDRPLYRIFTGDQIESVRSLHPEAALTPLLTTISSDYLILAPDSFRVILQPLADFHGAQIIDIDNVYREYSGGQMDPHAIKAFLKQVWSQGPAGLRYVLIAMQGKWFGWEGSGGARQVFIPAMKIQTYGFGAVASDTWYTLVSGDDFLPDFAIGRFPAQNRAELETMVAKTMNYLTRGDLSSDNRLLMIGGYEATFKSQSESLIDPILRQGYFPKRLYIDQYSEGGPFFGNTDTLLAAMNEGLWYINFLGHGGGAVWGDRSLLTLGDLPQLTNTTQTPVVTSMTCFTGDVTNPNALGRRMVGLSDGGALAWLGSAGVGWIINDFLLLEPINRHLFSEENWTLGELINQGKIEDLATNLGFPGIAKTQIYQFNLTGDPALPLRRPQNAALSVAPVVQSGGNPLTVSGIPPAADSLTLCLYDRDNLPQGRFSEPTITLPPSIPPGLLRINVGWKDGNQLVHGSVCAGVDGSLVRIVEIIPAIPTERDSIQILVEAADPAGLNSVFIQVNGIRQTLTPASEPDRFTLESPLPPFPLGATVYFEPGAVNASQQETWGPVVSLTIRPTIQPRLTELSFLADDQPGLEARVSNPTIGTGSIELMFAANRDSAWVDLGRTGGSLAGVNAQTFRLNTALRPGPALYRVILSSGPGFPADTLEREITPTAFWVTPLLGTTGDLARHQAVGIPPFAIEIQPGAVSEPEVLRLATFSPEDLLAQEGLQFCAPENSPAAIDWQISSELPLTVDWTVTFPDSVAAHLFIFDPARKVWERVADSDQTTAWNGPGRLAWFTIHDQEIPAVEVSLNGQHFLYNSYISASPRISVVAQDNSGMDFRPEAVQFWVNRNYGDSRPPFQVSGRGTVATYEFTPHLAESDTLLEIRVRDAAGNPSDTLALQFIVRTNLELLDYGNYPNPFKDQTRFAYELTDNVDQFSLDIYTVSGRRIRHFGPRSTLTDLDSRSGAYHEIIWDGRDESGRFVSNGVYFYRYQVTKGKRTLSHQGKAAKAR